MLLNTGNKMDTALYLIKKRRIVMKNMGFLNTPDSFSTDIFGNNSVPFTSHFTEDENNIIISYNNSQKTDLKSNKKNN